MHIDKLFDLASYLYNELLKRQNYEIVLFDVTSLIIYEN